MAKEQARLRADFDKLLKDHVRLKKDYNELKSQLARPVPASPAATDSSKRLRQVLSGGGGGDGDGNQEESPESPQRRSPIATTTTGMSLSTATAFAQYDEDNEEEYTHNPFEDSVAAFPLYKVGDQVELDSRMHSPAGHNASIREVCLDRQEYKVSFALGGKPKWIKQTDVVQKGW